LDDGRVVTDGKKYQRAVELGTKIMTEREFELFCKHKFDSPDFLLGRKRAKDATEGAYEYFAGADAASANDGISKVDDISDLLTDLSDTKVLPLKRAREFSGKPGPSSNSTNTKPQTPVAQALLWVDKYAPKSQNDIMGNKTVIRNFESWLQDWDDVVIRGNKKPVDFKKKDPPKLNAKACLISGSPGIGKTTTVRIIGQKLGFHILELNASDVRSKNKIEELLKDLSKA
jgi:hypothetical protein